MVILMMSGNVIGPLFGAMVQGVMDGFSNCTVLLMVPAALDKYSLLLACTGLAVEDSDVSAQRRQVKYLFTLFIACTSGE